MSPGRNDPCPCGSGLKYKKCHGAVIPVAAAPAPGTRTCGECTACCDGWVKGTIQGHDMFPGQPCFFRGEAGGGGCTIYDRRPQHPCRAFICGWVAPGSPFPESFRPDRLGVMVIGMKWRGRDAYVLAHAGRDPDDATVAWMEAFCERTGRPFFYERGGERFGFGPPEFQAEMADKLARGEPLWRT